MTGNDAGRPPRCSECGETTHLVADLPRSGLRPRIGVFKCTGCARIMVCKDHDAGPPADLGTPFNG
ncbi:hypothetical protein BJ122_101293 [Rhodopseudomonas faecalis]|uniref:Uncharacterized protein n=1 Tax=Rhodopseudomonas faecalis TaxID=99655 RepID=A0A318TNV3_9BRAD|nr:hypothetical protein BJ122_101293 [Rhodopseudomonas faecalis]